MVARRLIELDVVGDRPTCRAPATSLHLSVAGTVHACCENGDHELGDLRTQTLAEVWGGARRRAMAAELAAGTYPYGCDRCAVLHAAGARASTPAPTFDPLGPEDAGWPRRLEFTLSNRCNLACVQCNGENSSTIRSREGRPPLPAAYGEELFAQLPPFLERVEVVAFLGGEPFLMPEARRIWDLLLELPPDRRPVVQVTTNATVWSDAVERYVRELGMHLTLSIDGHTAATYEAVRVGARHDRVVDVRDRLIATSRAGGGDVQLNYCLLRANWHEVGAFLADADRLDVGAQVVPVFEPADQSVFTLDPEAHARMVAALDAEDVERRPHLGRNRRAWEELVGLVRGHRPAAVASVAPARPAEPGVADALAAALATWSGRPCLVTTVEGGRLVTVEAPDWARPLAPEAWAGARLDELEALVAGQVGPLRFRSPDLAAMPDAPGVIWRECEVDGPSGPAVIRTASVEEAGLLLMASPDLA